MSALDIVFYTMTTGVFIVLTLEVGVAFRRRIRRTDEPFAAARNITGRINR